MSSGDDGSPHVVLDANTLYAAPLNALLVALAKRGLFRARWTERIHQEWMGARLGKDSGLDPKWVEDQHHGFITALPDARVEQWERYVEDVVLPDPSDRHVVAAALASGAGWIVTDNIRDFPRRRIRPHGLRAIKPDPFLVELVFDRHPRDAESVVRGLVGADPLAHYTAALRRQRLDRTARWVRRALSCPSLGEKPGKGL